MKRIQLIVTFIWLLSSLGNSQDLVYSKQEIIEDLEFLQDQLQEKHPNIEVYTTSKEFDDFFKNLSVPDRLTETEAYRLICSSNEVIQDGHTLFYPREEFMTTNNESGYFLPFQPFWDGQKLFVRKSYSDSSDLIVGQEIISINGIQSEEVIQEMLTRMMRDGSNFNYPIWVLNTYFFEYYSYFYGCHENYDLVLKSNKNEKRLSMKGILKTILFQKLSDPRAEPEVGISIGIDIENSIGVLIIKDWHRNKLKKYYNQKFIPEVKETIEQLEENNIENLIIDIRDNQGGDTKYSKYLLSYLLDDPFKLVEGYYKKKKGGLSNSNGPHKGIHQPLSTTFDGNIYVLTNGGSFSNSGIFCSALKKHNRATFIGEETGGSEFVLASHSKSIKLPNTEIVIAVPRLQYLIKNYDEENLHGILPDFEISPGIEDLLVGRDVIMEYAQQLIKENRVDK